MNEWESFFLHPFQEKTVFFFLMKVVENTLESDASKLCAFRTLQCFFEHANLETIQKIQRVTYPENQQGNEATKIISKQANKILNDASKQAVHGKSDSRSHSSPWGTSEKGGTAEGEDLTNALSESECFWNVVYSCIVAVVCQTQTQVKFFEKFIFMDGSPDIWHALIPSRINSKTEPRFFDDSGKPIRLSISDQLPSVLPYKRKPPAMEKFVIPSPIFESVALDEDFEANFSTGKPNKLTGDDELPSLPEAGVPSVSKIDQQLFEHESTILDLDAINSLPAMNAI